MMQNKLALLPWQNKTWHALWQTWKSGRLPHALLFAGTCGIGKKIFTQMFVRALFCAHPDTDGYPCHACSSCHWLEAQSHPDMLWVEPEKIGQAIKVDQIREVIEFAQKTALQGTHRIVVIYPATNMNTNAANALLKTLEEPTPHTFIILVSHQNSSLPATILSRCQQIAFPKPAHAQALSWLRPQLPAAANPELLLTVAQGAPLQALEMHTQDFITLRTELFAALLSLSQGQGDPLTYAAKWQETETLPMMDCFFGFLLDLLRLQHTPEDPYNRDFEPKLRQLAERLSSDKVLAYIDYIQQIRRYVVQSFNLNKQLLLEDLLLRWVAHVAS